MRSSFSKARMKFFSSSLCAASAADDLDLGRKRSAARLRRGVGLEGLFGLAGVLLGLLLLVFELIGVNVCECSSVWSFEMPDFALSTRW